MNEELRIIIRAVSDEAQRNLAGVREELENINEESRAAGKTIGESMKAIGKNVAVALGAVAALTTAIVALGKSSLEFQKQQAKLVAGFQASGSSAAQANKTYVELFRFLGDSDTATEAAQSLARITTNTEDLAEWTKILQGVYARAGNAIPVESLAEAANETIRVGVVTGSVADALNWLGVSEDAFNEKLAATSSLEEREILLRNTLNSLYGNAANIYERNNQALIRYQESQARLDTALAEAGKYITPLLTELNILSATLLTALAPAIEVVAIYLTAFIQLIIEAIQWVGSFFGLFSSGAEDATADVKGYRAAMDNYLGGLGSGFDTANDGITQTRDNLEKLKKQTMGFDELNIVQDPSVPSAGITGGGAGGGGFSSVDMPNPEDFGLGAGNMADFTESIKDAKDTIKSLAIVAGAAAIAFGAWKLAGFISELRAAIGLLKLAESGMFSASIAAQKASKYISALVSKLKLFGGMALVAAGVALVVDAIKSFIQNGYSMKAVIEVTIGVIVTLIGVILLFNASLLASPVTWIVIAIIALVAVFVILWNECEGFRNFWIGLWENIKIAFSAAVEALTPLFNSIVNAFKEAWELIKAVWDIVEPYIIQAWENIKAAWAEAQPYFGVIWEAIKASVVYMLEIMIAQFKLAWEAIKAVWNVVIAYFKAIWDSIAAIFSVVRNVLQGNWKEAWEGIKSIVSIWANYFKTVWENIKKVFSAVGTYFSTCFEAAGKAIRKIFDGITKYFGDVWTKIKDTFTKVGTAIADGISGAVKGAINAVLGTAVKIINGFISAINIAIDVLNAVPGVAITKLSKLEVPKLAKGGIVESATLALFGENGREAVLPLENNTQWMDALAERLASRNNTPSKIVLALDGKELGYATINSINDITRQSGELQLVLV